MASPRRWALDDLSAENISFVATNTEMIVAFVLTSVCGRPTSSLESLIACGVTLARSVRHGLLSPAESQLWHDDPSRRAASEIAAMLASHGACVQPGLERADSYRPRNPEQSVLYRVVAGHLETFLRG